MNPAPTPQSIRGILFDLDGTLIDAFPPIVTALNQTLEEFGKPAMTPEEIRRHTGRGGMGGMAALFTENLQEATKRFLEIHDALFLKQIRAIDGAEALLGWLYRDGVPMAVVTSKGQQRAEAQIELLGWKEYFRAVIGKVDGRPEKPDPTPMRMAYEAMELTPAESIVIGDGVADMTAGCRAGLFTVGLVDAYSKEELEESGAMICFGSLDEISGWLRKKIS